MARAYVDEETENSFLMIDRCDFILWGLATAATMTGQGGSLPQASLELTQRETPPKNR